MNCKKLFLVCTETSGDLLGARLVQAMRSSQQPLHVLGVGGPLLEAQGMELVHHIRDFNVMGMVEVISQLWRLRAQFHELRRAVAAAKPDAIVLIDAPDFNMRFARSLRPLGIPTIYYVSPQVWAWRRKRARLLAQWVDHLMVLFRFEETIYRDLGLPTTWVGHPLVDEVRSIQPDPALLEPLGLSPEKPLIVLAPGSRSSVVRRLLPVMAQVARRRGDRWQFVLTRAHSIDAQEISGLLADAPVTMVDCDMRRMLAHATAAVVASGTATLETALMKVPMIVGYKMNPLSHLLAKSLVRLPHIAMVNIVLQKAVVPELIQGAFEVDRVIALLDQIVSTGPIRRDMIDAYEALPELLGNGGASQRAAEVVWRYLKP